MWWVGLAARQCMPPSSVLIELLPLASRRAQVIDGLELRVDDGGWQAVTEAAQSLRRLNKR